jgi:transcriptional regulator with XRE-family HTH domain
MPMQRAGEFADKLTLVLKALSISRARLASAAGVDKSLVGRWCAGTYAPAAHNLERITQTIAERVPGFTMHDWDRSIADLAASFGVERPWPAVEAADTLMIPVPPAIAAATRARAADYEGIWRVTYSAGVNEQPDMFVQSYGLMRLEPGGQLSCRAGIFDVRLEGAALLVNNQLFQIAINPARGTVSLAMFNCVAEGKAQILDGITLSCRDGLGGIPMATPCYSERVADLSGDVALDDQRFSALCAQHPVLPDGATPQHIRDHLLRPTGRAAAAAGGDLLLMMPHLRSLARSSDVASAPPALRIVS